ncbi:hypothetical protein K493DRAFT_319845 [Basidiobolus meristosporus CBS 931.73]|uniref:CBM21 domain-containing protein n=1 Tax=Basidiobolus meristosporus CBS 931.73 TaxID=1314790 RepID=A0A1Y1XKE3_9FUNG|nr:hypothetical protein K493DRAFT_319845 [Basidiobolus meristosporus CBS 931.73]|eukprot:ORX86163.1 hypothetical protein K493DRAFT_319845 [Basidiobolus meristosporus CBS 931.73]
MHLASESDLAQTSTWPRRRVLLRSSCPNPLLESPKSPELSKYAQEPSSIISAPAQEPSPSPSETARQQESPRIIVAQPNDTQTTPAATEQHSLRQIKEPVIKSKKPSLTIPIPSCLVRKKSGEIVKSALKGRTRSMPTTPTKFVHFGAKLEQVKLFQKEQKPESISNPVSDDEDDCSSDEDTEYELTIRLPNFPPPIFSRSIYNSKTISVDKVFLSEDKRDLVGTLQVQNLAFRKVVAVRYTFDFWRTVEEVVADYKESPVKPCPQFVGIDRFSFAINLENRVSFSPSSPKKTMFFAVRYQVNNQEFWDNNDGMNYQVDLVYSKPYRFQAWPFDIGKSAALISPDPGDFSSNASNPFFKIGSPEAPVFLNLSNNQFGSRYDFGISLSAPAESDCKLFEKIPTRGSLDRDPVFNSDNSAHDLKPKSSLSSLFAHSPPQKPSEPLGSSILPWDEQPVSWNGYDSSADHSISSPNSASFTNPVPIPGTDNSSSRQERYKSENEQSYSGLYAEPTFGGYSSSPRICG